MILVPESSPSQRTVIDGTIMSYTGLFLPLGVLAAVLAWNLARRRGLNQPAWAVVCLLFFPALIVLAFVKPRQRVGDTPSFRERWASLAAYDPDIKPAIERLAELGPAAVDAFRLAYADVQTREAIPLIVADLERRWAAGDRFNGSDTAAQRLAERHRQGRISAQDYAKQTRRLRERGPKGRWSGWWWKAPAILLLVLLFWPRGGPAGFPTCEAGTTREIVRRAIEEGEDAKIRNTRLLALDEIKELSHDAGKPERYCAGLAALNAGDRRIGWRLFQRGHNLLVEVSGL